MFEPRWRDECLSPFERCGIVIVHFDEIINGPSQLGDGKETCPSQGMPSEQAEPDLNLIEPRGMGRREVEMNVRMASQPAIMFGLVGAEVIQDDMNFFLGITGDDVIHEVEELAAPTPRIVPRLNQSRCHLKRSEERAGSVSCVFVTETRDRLAVGQSQPALCAFQRLNMGFLIHTKHRASCLS